jgi:Putative esterase
MRARHFIGVAIISFFVFTVLAAPCLSQEKTGDVSLGSTYCFRPKNIEGRIDVSLHFPEDYEKSGAKYPVLYLLDVEKDFVFGSAVADFLAANERIPGVIVVGIFLGNSTGGPPQLIEFFENELFPFVDKSARVEPCRVLYGHSARSFATLFVLLNRPDLFYGYIGAGLGLTSPPWTTAVDLVKLADAKLSEMKSLRKSFYFVLGNEQVFLPAVGKFVEILKAKAPAGFDWKYENMPDDDHFSNKLKTLYAGLEFVFRGWRLPLATAEAGPEAIKAHYDRLSERLGFAIGLPARPIHRAVMDWLAYENEVDPALTALKSLKDKYAFDAGVEPGDLRMGGFFAMNSGKLDDAIKIYTFLCREYPESAQNLNGLGEVYEKDGKSDLARANFEKAVALAMAKNDPELKKYQDNLARLKRQK